MHIHNIVVYKHSVYQYVFVCMCVFSYICIKAINGCEMVPYDWLKEQLVWAIDKLLWYPLSRNNHTIKELKSKAFTLKRYYTIFMFIYGA